MSNWIDSTNYTLSLEELIKKEPFEKGAKINIGFGGIYYILKEEFGGRGELIPEEKLLEKFNLGRKPKAIEETESGEI